MSHTALVLLRSPARRELQAHQYPALLAVALAPSAGVAQFVAAVGGGDKPAPAKHNCKRHSATARRSGKPAESACAAGARAAGRCIAALSAAFSSADARSATISALCLTRSSSSGSCRQVSAAVRAARRRSASSVQATRQGARAAVQTRGARVEDGGACCDEAASSRQ